MLSKVVQALQWKDALSLLQRRPASSAGGGRHLEARQLKHALERLHVGERLADGVGV